MTSTAPSLHPSADPPAAPSWRPRPWLAAVLNVSVPGLGQLYVGRPARALGTFLGVHAAGAALLAPTFVVSWAPVRVALVAAMFALVWPVMAWDGWRTAHRHGVSRRRGFQRWYTLLGLLVLHAFVIQPSLMDWTKQHLVEAFRIPSLSMAPTLVPGDLVFVTKGMRGPVRRGDVVVNDDDRGIPYVRRVVGLPGDTLEMRRYQLLLNGTPVVEPYASLSDSAEHGGGEEFGWQRDHRPASLDRPEQPATSGTWGPLVVPPDDVFLLGDRRDESLDSRYLGFIPRERLRGRPRWIYFSSSPEDGAIRWRRLGQAVR